MITKGTRSGLSSVEVSRGVSASVRVILSIVVFPVEGNIGHNHVCEDSQ